MEKNVFICSTQYKRRNSLMQIISSIDVKFSFQLIIIITANQQCTYRVPHQISI